MTTYAVARVHQIMDTITRLTTAKMCHHAEQCEEITRWLCDEQSRQAYQRELIYMHLRALLGMDSALTHAANVTINQWNAGMDTVRRWREEGKLPALRTDLPDEHPQVLRLFTSTFVFQQYEYNPHVGVREGDVVLDCGACFGESSIWAVAKGAAASYAFEPNPATAACTRANAEEFGAGRVHVVEAALGSEPGTVSFLPLPDHPGASHIAPSGGENTVPVSCITLDQWCAAEGVRPDFIKMDLEGEEMSAIIGAAQTITEYKPRLGICLYHRIEDMWTLPQALKMLCPEYRFWCRKNAADCEFVLYASAEPA